MSRQRKAFTLVELLVVIGIIAVLIGVLLPTLAAVRKSANMLKCQATERELGLALQMYAQQFKGYMPAGRQGRYDFNHGSIQMNQAWCFWWMRLQQQKLIPGIDDPTRGVALCPSDDSPYWPFQEFPNNQNLQTSYGLNPYMSVATDGVGVDQFHPEFPKRAPLGICDNYGHQQRKVTGMKNSSEVIVLAEIRYGWFPNWFAPNTFEAAQTGSEWFDWDWYRHSKSGVVNKKNFGRLNVLWLDGHVSTVNRGKDQPSYFKNDIYAAAWWGPYCDVAVSERGKKQWGWLPSVDGQ